MREEFNRIKAETAELITNAKTNGLTPEAKAEIDKRFGRMNEIKTLIATEKTTAENADIAAIKEIAAKTFTKKEITMENTINLVEEIKTFARSGKPSTEFTLTSATSGGIAMPKSLPFMQAVAVSRNAIRRGFAALGVPTFSSSTTENIGAIFMDDSANTGSNSNEGGTGLAADPTPSGSLDLVEYQSKALWLSKKLVNAVDFDVTGYVVPTLLSRIDRGEEIDWVAAIVADSAAVAVTAADDTAITYAEWVTLDGSLDPAHSGIPQFYLVSTTAKAALRGLVDGSGKPLLSLENGVDKIFGKPLIVSANMETVAAGNIVAALISVENSIIRDCTANELVRYEGESSHPASIGFEAIGYSAFAYKGSVKTLKMAAS